MSSTFAIIALSSLVSAAPYSTTIAFEKNYTDARQLGREQAKPLAIFIGVGEQGWEKICRERMESTSEKLLAEKYVCVYVNRDEEHGKRLATEFEIAEGPGLVISDRTGELQAFRHTGDMSNDVLTKQLQRFADSNVVVQETETLNSNRPSSYSPGRQVAPANVQFYQNYYPPNFGGTGGGCVGGR